MLYFEIDATGVEEMYSRAVADLETGYKAPLQTSADLLAQRWQQAFDQGGWGGKQWAPLAKSTLAERRRKGIEGTRPLRAYEEYMKSVTAVKPDVAGSLFENDGTTLSMGNRSAKAFNQYPPRRNKSNRRRNTPARPLPTEFEDDIKGNIVDAFGDDLTARMQKVMSRR